METNIASSSQLPQPGIQPAKKKKTMWLIVAGSVLVVALTAVGIYFFVVKKPASMVTNIQENTTNGTSTSGDTQEVVASGPDADSDGLSDADETKYSTDSKNPDTDGDGFNDGAEVQKGFDPLGPGNAVTASVSTACQGGNFVFNPETTAAEVSSQFNQVNVEIILDGSGSMLENIGGEKKIDAAKRVINQIIDSLPDKKNLNVGFRAYGFQSPGSAHNCQDSKLLVPIKGVDKQALKNATNSIKAQGYTPIAYSLEQAAKDFPAGDKNFNTVILISDGIESCGGNPADVAKQIYQRTGLKVNTHVVGLGVGKNDADTLQKIAQNAGGTYNTANDVDALNGALSGIIKKIISGGTLHVVYRDSNNKPFTDPRFLDIKPAPAGNIFDQYLGDNGEITLSLDPGTYTFKVDAPGIQQQDIAKPKTFQAVIKEGYETVAQISLGKVQVLFPTATGVEQPTMQGSSMELLDLCSEKQDNAVSLLSKNWPTLAFTNLNTTVMDAEVYPGLYRVVLKAPRSQKVVAIEALKTTTVDYSHFFGILNFTKPVFNLDYPNFTQMADSAFVFPCCSVTKPEKNRGSFYAPGRDYYSVYAFPGSYEIKPSFRTDMQHGYKLTVNVEPGKTTKLDPQPTR